MKNANKGNDVTMEPRLFRRGIHTWGIIVEKIRKSFSVPAAVWSRAAALLLFLGFIKIGILWTFREHLYQIHWRINKEAFTWASLGAFLVFAVLTGIHLWQLGEACREGGARRVRFANLFVLATAALFLLLTFHEGDKNYLYALLDGILTFKDIKWYLIMNFCFRMPFLAAWILAYGFFYYGFVRTGRECLMLRVTAVFASLYILACLRDLMVFRAALTLADCFGIACLVPWRRSNSFSWWRIFLPVVLSSILFFVFARFGPQLRWSHWSPQFTVLFYGTLIVFGASGVYAKLREFAGAWSRIFPFAFTAFLLLINTWFPPAANYRNLLGVGLALPHYFVSGLGIAVLMLLCGCFYRKLRPGGTLWWMDGINLLVVMLSLADLRLSQIMGVRLDWDVLSLAFGETPKMMWRMARPYLPSLTVAIIVLVVLYALTIRFITRVVARRAAGTRQFGGEAQFVGFALLVLAITGKLLVAHDKAEGQTVVRLIQTSPVMKNMSTSVLSPRNFAENVRALGIDFAKPSPVGSDGRQARDLNVVLIFQESTYNKHLSLFGSAEDTQPLLSKYKDRMEIFPNFFSSFTGSINARFATFTGLYPVRDYSAFTTRRIPVKSIFEVLNEQGYACSMFYSSFFDYTGFRDFLRGRGLGGMFDADNMPGQRLAPPVSWGLQESETLEAIKQQVKTYAADHRKFFLTYVPAAPHNPFDGTPREFQKYKREKMGDFSPLYRNELLYMDWVISSIIDQLKEAGVLDKTLVVITADHGEMLGEDGGPIGHGWRVTPELQNVPLIIMDPATPKFRINDTIGSQVDVMPTMLDLLGIPLPPSQLYEGASLYSSDSKAARTIYINSFLQYGIIQNRQFICGSRENASDSAASEGAYTITNDGPRTIFIPVNRPGNAPSIAPFDEFQDNFLFHYADYCHMAAEPRSEGH